MQEGKGALNEDIPLHRDLEEPQTVNRHFRKLRHSKKEPGIESADEGGRGREMSIQEEGAD